VSIPLAASAYPVECRSMWTCTGNDSPAASPPFNHASNAHPAEGLTALIDEDVGPLGPVSLLLPSQELKAVKLVPLHVMNAVGTALEPADDNVRCGSSISSQRRSQTVMGGSRNSSLCSLKSRRPRCGHLRASMARE
jgi:hypothetical protein